MSAVERETDTKKETALLKEFNSIKDAVANVLHQKAIENENEKEGAFYYLLSKTLNSLKTTYRPGNLIAATDGEKFYIGDLIEPFLDESKRDTLTGIIIHETLHVVYGHVSRMKLASDKTLYNIVADLYVNTLISRRLGIKLSNTFVTLDSMVNFIISNYGILLSQRQKEAINQLARYEVSDEVSVDSAYNTISMLTPEIIQEIKNKYSKGKFFGHDISDNLSGTPNEGDARQNQDKKELLPTRGAENLRKLNQVKEEIKRTLDKLNEALGEYKVLMSASKKMINDDTIIASEEYKQMKTFLIPIESRYFADVAKTLRTEYTFAKNDSRVYWLPAKVKMPTSKVLALIDASPSVSLPISQIFLNMIVNAMNKYKIEYDLCVFSTGETGFYTLSPSIRTPKLELREGTATIFDSSIAKRIREAREQHIKLIQILSDFDIEVEPEVLNEITDFKRAGGRISCYTITGRSLPFCDSTFALPKLPK